MSTDAFQRKVITEYTCKSFSTFIEFTHGISPVLIVALLSGSCFRYLFDTQLYRYSIHIP